MKAKLIKEQSSVEYIMKMELTMKLSLLYVVFQRCIEGLFKTETYITKYNAKGPL